MSAHRAIKGQSRLKTLLDGLEVDTESPLHVAGFVACCIAGGIIAAAMFALVVFMLFYWIRSMAGDHYASFWTWKGLLATAIALGISPGLVAAFFWKLDDMMADKISHPGSPVGHALRRDGWPAAPGSSADNMPVHQFESHETPKGNSKFAALSDVQHSGIWTPAEMATLPDRDQGPYLGRFLDGDEPNGVIRYTGPKHLMTIGPPGSNKSMGLAVQNIVNLRRSMIIVDSKCQLAPMTYRERKKMGEVIVINPFGQFAKEYPHLKSQGFNPLASLDPESDWFEPDAASIAQCLIPMDPHEHQKIFPQGARDLMTAAIMWERMNNPDASLVSVRRALCAMSEYDEETGVPISGFVKTLFDMATCKSEPLRNLASPLIERITNKNSGQTSIQDMFSTARTHTQRLDDRPIARDLQGKGINFGQFREKIVTCYIILPPSELKTYGVWLRLVVGSALNALYHTPLPAQDKTLPPVYFLLDEFAALGRLEEIENALTVSRDYHVQMHVLIQYLSQLKTSYPETWHGFFSGAGAITAFAPGDLETAEYLSKVCGQRTVNIRGSSVNLGHDGKTTPGHSWSQQSVPLIQPEEIMRMPRGKMLCSVQDEPMPFYTDAPIYTETPFAALLDDNPYFRKRAA